MSSNLDNITDCACGNNHNTMPMIDGVEGVCRKHKRHIPCRKCMRAVREEQIGE